MDLFLLLSVLAFLDKVCKTCSLVGLSLLQYSRPNVASVAAAARQLCGLASLSGWAAARIVVSSDGLEGKGLSWLSLSLRPCQAPALLTFQPSRPGSLPRFSSTSLQDSLHCHWHQRLPVGLLLWRSLTSCPGSFFPDFGTKMHKNSCSSSLNGILTYIRLFPFTHCVFFFLSFSGKNIAEFFSILTLRSDTRLC